jgi:hypothetical protein
LLSIKFADDDAQKPPNSTVNLHEWKRRLQTIDLKPTLLPSQPYPTSNPLNSHTPVDNPQAYRIKLDKDTVMKNATAWEVEQMPGGWGAWGFVKRGCAGGGVRVLMRVCV